MTLTKLINTCVWGGVALISLSVVNSAQAMTFDAAADFSITNGNPNGVWSYGYSTSLGGVFNPYPLTTSTSQSLIGLHAWYNSNVPNQSFLSVFKNTTAFPVGTTGTIPPGGLAFHPGLQGEFSIVRWTAPKTKQYDLEATFTGLDFVGPTTTDVYILNSQTTTPEFTGAINTFNIPLSHSNTLSLSAGDTLDFVVGVGSNGNYNFDTTGLDVKIKSVPEPASELGVLALGAIGVGSALKRRSKSKEQ